MDSLARIKPGSLQIIGGIICGINALSGEIVQLAQEHTLEDEVKPRRKRKAAAVNGEEKPPRKKRGMALPPADATPAELTSD